MLYTLAGTDYLIVERAPTLEKLLERLKSGYFYTDQLEAIEYEGCLRLFYKGREASGYKIIDAETPHNRRAVYCLKSLGPNSPRRPKKPADFKPDNTP